MNGRDSHEGEWVRVLADAVVGIGRVTQRGEIVKRSLFGDYAEALIRSGAIEVCQVPELNEPTDGYLG